MSSQIPKLPLNPMWKFLLPIIGLWVLLYGSYALSRPSLPDGPSTVHAEIAREMVTRNDWTTPYVNGFPVQASSRVLDWSIVASYKLFGIADWSARLPLALCVLALAITIFFFARKLFGGNSAGLYAALFVTVWPGTFVATRDPTPAPFLCLGTTLLAFVLWDLLISRRLALKYSIAVTVIAAALVLLIGGWPGALLPLAIVAICWLVRETAEPTGAGSRLADYWFLSVFLLEPVYSRYPGTSSLLLNATPPFALWLSDRLTREEANSHATISRRVAYVIFWAGMLLAAIAAFFAIRGSIDGTVFHTNVILIAPGERVPLLITAAALLAGVGGNLIFRLRNKARIANCFLAGTLGGLIVAIQVGMVMASPQRSSQILAEAIRPELDPADIVVIDGKYQDASSFAFYLAHPVLIAGQPAAGPPVATASPAGIVSVDQAWAGASRVFLWTSAAHPLTVLGASNVIATSGGKMILSNRRNTGGAAF